jgi:hypothetical protein
MLDMGFEKEMTSCLDAIKQRCPEKFTATEGKYWSDSLRINFVSATLGQRVERLGAKLMEKYETVGFDLENGEASDDENCSISIPKQVQ